jgi:hypothetical protein
MIVEKSIRAAVGLLKVACRISIQELVLQAVFVTSSIGILEHKWASQPTVPVTSAVSGPTGFGRECRLAGAVKS